MATETPKEATLRLVGRLADDATFEDIQYELYVLQKIQTGLRDVEAGRTVSHKEAGVRLARWLDPLGTTDG